MFSGIVETTARVLHAESHSGVVRISVEKPNTFNDLSIGDSVSVDGVCLTVETFNDRQMTFALGSETLQVTGWIAASLPGRVVNLERSLRLGDRVHGHLVTGHVDTRAQVLDARAEGEGLFVRIAVPESLAAYIWPKGSVTVNGASLTINDVKLDSFTVGLIPETLKRTNLKTLNPGVVVNLEVDNMARGLVRWAGLTRKGRV